MQEPLLDGHVRKLWFGENADYAAHLLRLDPESRRRRFGGAVSDDTIRQHAARARGLNVVIHGFFADGVLRGAAELRIAHPMFKGEAEAAFSIEDDWQSHGVGSALLERTLLAARNRGVRKLRMHCLAENERMQQLARKFDAELKFDFGSVIGDVDPPRSTALSLMRELTADACGFASTILDAQARLLGAA
jgi:RimJ/RimL family protein N-acetyltransferase